MGRAVGVSSHLASDIPGEAGLWRTIHHEKPCGPDLRDEEPWHRGCQPIGAMEEQDGRDTNTRASGNMENP